MELIDVGVNLTDASFRRDLHAVIERPSKRRQILTETAEKSEKEGGNEVALWDDDYHIIPRRCGEVDAVRTCGVEDVNSI
jgi:hypothetical protein